MVNTFDEHLTKLKLMLETAKLTSLMAYNSQNRRDYESAGRYRSSLHNQIGQMRQRVDYTIDAARKYGLNDYLTTLLTLQQEVSGLYSTGDRLKPQDATILIEKMYNELSTIGYPKTKKHRTPALTVVASISAASLVLLAISSTSPTARVVDPSSLTYPFGLAFLAIFLISLFFLKKGK